MNIFQKYAEFYDTLYKDKDYKKESAFLDKAFKKNPSKKIKNVLDLGCGTAVHDVYLAKKGYRLTGVDRSKGMLKLARKNISKAGGEVELKQADIRNFRSAKKFDAVMSNFAVMGYQTSNVDFLKAAKVARRHLKSGGIFIFDGWYGPAVLADRPKRVKKKVRISSNEFIERETKSKLDIRNQVVEITFLLKHMLHGRTKESLKEVHRMRFFFALELESLLSQAGFKKVEIFPFMQMNKKVTEDDWNIHVVAFA